MATAAAAPGRNYPTRLLEWAASMTTPKRIQQRRGIKGWRLPEGARSVTRWSKWANPFIIGEAGIPDAKTALRLYRMFMRIPGNPLIALLPELRGWHLACYCEPGEACHADILLELANVP